MNQIVTIEAGPEDQAFMAEHFDIPGDIAPGIYPGISNEAYHSGPGISKSGLWTIYNQTPAHYKFPPEQEELTTQQIAIRDFGSAVHVGILEPERFENAVFRGPKDRRGNNWKDAVAEATNSSRICLVAKDFDRVLAMRDAVHANPRIYSIITGGKPMIETSIYWTDPRTGLLCRARPDFYREDLGIMIDLKSTESAHPTAFAKSVVNYGYHAQEAHYTDGLNALGKPVEGTIFLAWEKKSPYASALYELPPSIVDDGRAIISKAMDTYAECTKSNNWPAYGDDVQELKFQRWSYREIDAPQFEEAA